MPPSPNHPGKGWEWGKRASHTLLLFAGTWWRTVSLAFGPYSLLTFPFPLPPCQGGRVLGLAAYRVIPSRHLDPGLPPPRPTPHPQPGGGGVGGAASAWL